MDYLKDANLLKEARMLPLDGIVEPRTVMALLTTHGMVILYGIADPETDKVFFAVRTHADDVRQNTALMRCLLEDSFTEAAPMEEMEKMLDPEAEGKALVADGSYPQTIAKRVAWHMAEEVGLRFPELMNRLVQ